MTHSYRALTDTLAVAAHADPPVYSYVVDDEVYSTTLPKMTAYHICACVPFHESGRRLRSVNPDGTACKIASGTEVDLLRDAPYARRFTILPTVFCWDRRLSDDYNANVDEPGAG